MNHTLPGALALSIAVLLTASPLARAEQQPAAGAGTATFVYKPPQRGAPARRVGGATRGSGAIDLALNVLSPEQTGFTTRAQPMLYWYAPAPATASLEVTVIADVAEQPLLTRSLTVTSGGVQSIDLAHYGISLQPETDYEWFVSVVSDSEQRSKDITSGGAIRLVAADPAMLARVAAAGERDAPGIYAEAGLWYDAIDALSRLIERNPGDAELRVRRAALLEQVGLLAAATHDRAATP